ncbi:MAG TPA: MTH1187 family thiamine-binding protein [Thermodesulfobacteriota bacterium]
MLVEFSVIPVGSGPQMKEPVAQVVDMIDKSGLPYQVTATSTIIEGDWDNVMPLVRRCLEDVRRGSPRVVATLKIDDEGGETNQLESNVRDVEEMLGKRPPSSKAVQTRPENR